MPNVSSETLHENCHMLHRYALDDLLDDVVAILVFDSFQRFLLQFAHQFSLLIDEDVLKSLFLRQLVTSTVNKAHTFCTTRQAYI